MISFARFITLSTALLLSLPAAATEATPTAATAAPAIPATTAAPQPPAVPYIIGSGSVSGLYYAEAGAVQRAVNDQNTSTRLAVQSTAGSVANLQDLISGKLDIAVVQSDWAYYASKGGVPPFLQPAGDLRVIMGLHPELLTVVVKADSPIKSIDDLKGKRINLGVTGSATRSLMNALIQSLGWTMTEMGSMLDLPTAQQSAALCNGQVDAITYLVQHPSPVVQETLNHCKVRLLPLSGRALDTMVVSNPFYTKTSIPAGSYASVTADVPAYGVRALLVTTSRLPDDAAYAVVKSIQNNTAAFNALHPVVARLSKADFAAGTYGIPLHQGAVKFNTEQTPAQ